MLHHFPKAPPPLADILADLGRPHPSSIAQALGVDERTARRWIKQGHAPRAAVLALFSVTSWGLQWRDADAHNHLTAWRRLALAQDRELKRTQERAAAMARALLMSSARVADQIDPRTLGHVHAIEEIEAHAPPAQVDQRARAAAAEGLHERFSRPG